MGFVCLKIITSSGDVFDACCGQNVVHQGVVTGCALEETVEDSQIKLTL